MSKFNTKKNKIEKIWNDVESSKNQIDKKSNQDKIDFFTNLSKSQNIKTPIEIYNSGDIVPTLLGCAVTAVKSEKMPSTLSYSQSIDLEIPEDLLPFVKYSVEVTPLSEVDVHTVYEYDPSTWVGDNIRVEGDGILIWKGVPLVRHNLTTNPVFITHKTQYLQDKGISLSLTKNAWTAFFERNVGNNVYGFILYFSSSEIIGENTCIENSDTKTFGVNVYRKKEHKIISLTSDSITAIGNETITTWIWNAEDEKCESTSIINENVTRTKYFDSVENYGFRLAEFSQTGIYYFKDQIKSKRFNNPGRWLFYSNKLNAIFQTIETSNKDGDFEEIKLRNLPRGDGVPYNNITLKRNLESYNTKPTIQYGSRGHPNKKSLCISSRNFKNYVKISESTAPIPTYRFKLDGNFIISSPSTAKKIIRKNESNIITQEFEKKSSNWYALINEDESDELSGIVQNIYHKKTRLGGSVITEFFSDPINNSNHGITNLTSTTFTAVGDETVTIIPIEGDPIITKRNNIIIINEAFNDHDDFTVTYSLSILDTVDFPIYNDIYTKTEIPPEDPEDPPTYKYQRTENHEILSKEVWKPESQDVILNIKAYLSNPFNWREQRKYIKNDF